MGRRLVQKISISLDPRLLLFAESYRARHGLTSRSEVVAAALELLRQQELAEGFRAMAEEAGELERGQGHG